jgi:hypothetical protein
MSENKQDQIIDLLKSMNKKLTQLLEALQPHREYEKLPKSAKKLDAGAYTIAKTRCKFCGGRISWDGYSKDNPIPPIHVHKDGTIKGDGRCPEGKD